MKSFIYLCVISAVVAIMNMPRADVATSDKYFKLMPEDLISHAKENGCQQVHDFYNNRSGMINPPYVYGYLAEGSAVYWCQDIDGVHGEGEKDKDKTQPTYSLIIRLGYPNIDIGCPTRIRSKNYPMGLSILDGDPNLINVKEFFYYLDDPNRPLPEDFTIEEGAVIIENSYEVGEYYYCHKGSWIIMTFD